MSQSVTPIASRTAVREKRLLALEDQPDAVEGTLSALEYDAVHVVLAEDLGRARLLLREETWDFVLLDQRVVDSDGKDDPEGGTKLARTWKSGRLGSLNRTTPFSMMTADRSWVTESDIQDLSGYLPPVLVKEGDLTRKVRSQLKKAWPGWIPFDERSDARRSRHHTLVVVEGLLLNSEPHTARMRVPGWDRDDELLVPIDSLPEFVAEEVEHNPAPIYLFADVDLSAVSTAELSPINWELGPVHLDEGLLG